MTSGVTISNVTTAPARIQPQPIQRRRPRACDRKRVEMRGQKIDGQCQAKCKPAGKHEPAWHILQVRKERTRKQHLKIDPGEPRTIVLGDDFPHVLIDLRKGAHEDQEDRHGEQNDRQFQRSERGQAACARCRVLGCLRSTALSVRRWRNPRGGGRGKRVHLFSRHVFVCLSGF